MEEKKLKDMTLEELHEYITSRLNGGDPFLRDECMEMQDYLGRKIAYAGALWDMVDGTDPLDGPPVKYGTRNHKSMTYKCRELAGYSYP